MKIETLLKVLAWAVFIPSVLVLIGFGGSGLAQQAAAQPYPGGYIEASIGDTSDSNERYLNESQLMQLVAFDDNAIPKKTLNNGAIPKKTSKKTAIPDKIDSNNISSNNMIFNNTNNNTNSNNTSSNNIRIYNSSFNNTSVSWLGWVKTV